MFWCRMSTRNQQHDMDACCVHHVEFGVRDGEENSRRLIEQYKFALTATRSTENLKQWVLQSGNVKYLLTQLVQPVTDAALDDTYCAGWLGGRQGGEPSGDFSKIDSVFNIALKVTNLQSVVDKLSRSGETILKPVTTLTDSHGVLNFAIVRSCVGNVVHTLIDDSQYNGIFLPGFEPNTAYDLHQSIKEQLVSRLDHVTYACASGDSGRIIEWYSKCFGMRRFLINRDEDEDSGFVIDTEDIGLRLKVFEYWKCAETGVASGSHPDSVKFVIAEALQNQGPNQVDTFLQDHGGPGIQHIGMHTDDIVDTVASLNKNGVKFAEPPYTYYTEVGKLEEIRNIGADVDSLKENGILVDAEFDLSEQLNDPNKEAGLRYLMQKFTKPLFGRNTFFLEVIQRVGAIGFGSGNITALWRSVQAYMSDQKKDT